MENQNQNKNRNENEPNSAGQQPDTATGGKNATTASMPSTGAEDMLRLMDQSQNTCTLGQWVKCMRKPALSFQYTLDKRHIPDMDSETADKNGGLGQNNASASIKGANSDVMTLKGGFSIRYFDLGAGLLTLLAAGCLIKTCYCLTKRM